MQIYLAPLQGLTDWIFREAYTEHLAAFDKTFTPFVRVQNGEFYRPSQCNDLLPENNVFQKPVPQFLGNDFESFRVFEELCLKHGYCEANINMGCPYPMVTGKKMGAGLLAYPELIDQLLKRIFAETNLKVSVKCRMGMENSDQINAIIPVFNAHPLSEIIVHARIGKQQYKGNVDKDKFIEIASRLKHNVVYNGDIQTVADVNFIKSHLPDMHAIMIGRSLLGNPFLCHEIKGISLSIEEKQAKLHKFHTALIEHCKKKYSGDLHFLKRMEELWEYQSLFFTNGHKIFKQIKKSKSLSQYEDVVFQAIKEFDIVK